MTQPNFEYPAARKGEVVDQYHGKLVADPYRWMEDPNSTETQTYIAAQNELTEAFLSEIPARAMILKRLTELADYEKWSAPTERSGRYFYFYNDGLRNQPSLFFTSDLEAPPTLLIDPNTLSDDGTVAINAIYPSPDGKYVAYTVAVHGSDRQTVHIRAVETQTDLPEILDYCRFTSIAWIEDSSGFFYDRYPKPSSVPPEEEQYHNSVYWHQLGETQVDDQLIYAAPDEKELGFRPQLSDDGDYLILNVWYGAIQRNRIYIRKIASQETFVPLIPEANAFYEVIGNNGPIFYVETDLDAPRGKLVQVDLDQPDPTHWIDLIPEAEHVIDTIKMVGDRFVIQVTRDVLSQIQIYTLAGELEQEAPLPGPGSVSQLTGHRAGQSISFSFQSYLTPPTIFEYFPTDGRLVKRFAPQFDFPFDQFTTEQHFYESKDGTRVPLMVVHKANLVKDGSHPTLLNGYGGFSISYMPAFSSVNLQWVEMGGIFVVANLRGGNEYGDEWHQAGMLENKQNVFDDFIAAGEWLIDQGYTSNKKLAIHGRSNGGLLTAVCMLQRPDLYGAVLCGVPVIDMLRYHLFTAGRYWVPEYGDPAKPDHFDFMSAYSPLHNTQPGVTYPPMLVFTAEADDRVVPMHALKYIATIQDDDSGKNPLLLRMDTKSGHGMGKPISKVLEEYADLYAFLYRMLEMQ